MKIKGFRLALLIMAVLMLCLSGCTKYKQIRPVSGKIEKIVPSGLRSVVVNAVVEIDNPASQLSLKDIEGIVYRSGKVFGRVTVDPFVLEPKTLGTYHLRAVVTLDDSVSLLQLMSMMKGNRLIEECTMDAYAKVSLKGGISKKISYEGLPLKKLYELVKK